MSNIKFTSKGLLIRLSLSLSDLFSFNASLFIAIWLMNALPGHLLNEYTAQDLRLTIITHIILSLICVGWFWVRLRHYTYRKPFWFELKEIFRSVLIFSVIDLSITALSEWELSRWIWVLTWLLALIFIPSGRAVVKRTLNRYNLWKRQSIIIGSGKNAEEAWMALQSEEMMGFDVVAFYDVDGATSALELFSTPVIRTEAALWELVDVDTQLIVAVEFEQRQYRDLWLKNLAKHDCRAVSVIPSLRGVPLYGTDMAYIFSHEVMILRVSNNLAKRTSRFLKRAFDIVGAMSIMIALMPALAVLIFLVSRDGGSPIYGHERVGLNGRKFKCLKFRSMVVNSKEVLEEVLRTDPVARAEWDKDFKLKNDPRITRVGHFIRKTSLDELPQLWNVVRGEMSLVGPRPVIEDELERYAGDVDYYYMAKPGMTGLWQVSGRNDVDYETRVYFDSWYVKNWSLWNDIAILFKTIGVVLKRDGAY
ncbi:undecaprenyl-phosphate galactose phosphotransferase WbaP [Erwinia tracheiphila]|uniref:UDP-phosphate galactose phosphotransferase n=1 Tax=Erwinia tracheiphila TaxID=65700 RepID=A0A0M2K6V7_9GAMM|nr:undecaprenyl-phosphate galactose phosphotransferase WbaP [Erwinia tracheiphila]EOS96444.1 UDP-galactose-lipid carrier transferase [Erwinia tracheiphila PSU-1]KKF35125.1 UDP-phosphate galactose phosphotransferase [Erwinia tracheiphila]UIA86781.1 undecaprenyl-phosphate galactose phosphotransferase WbaP [Erwinia tracheiphila]UIA95137.1 undecaprenyl-phosphate galactose phosphotransferase WbaP [Erwinia tracheiphila]